MQERLEVVRHGDLGAVCLDRLRELFDDEYLAEHGPWEPDRPYGYSPADVHVLALCGSEVVAHAGFQRRAIAVGDRDVVVGGTGGVLVSARARGHGLGGRVMRRLASAMADEDGVAHGYLGCREEVVPFYASAGWRRIHVTERSRSRRDGTAVVTTDDPILVLPLPRTVGGWPAGDVDLRGTPW